MRAQPPIRPDSSSPSRPIFLLFWCIGILLGLFARDFIETAGETVGDGRPVVAAGLVGAGGADAEPAATFIVNVHAVLDLPTATPAPTATPRPTATVERTPQPDFCGAVPATDGAVCRMPMPTATATPTLPACFSPAAEPGNLCQYRLTPTPVAEGR